MLLRLLISLLVITAVDLANQVYEEINIQPRVVGGHEATKGSYPWQVSIRVNGLLPGGQHACGGSIIAHDWVLTAAHCIGDWPDILITEILSVVAGEYDSTIEEGTEQRFDIEKVIVHENYSKTSDGSQSFYDVALIKIKGQFTFNDYVKPILMATSQQDDLIDGNSEMHCVASGWGSLQFGEPDSHILQETIMPLILLKACKEIFDNYMQVHDDMLCAGHLVEEIGLCNGDSGGPLACLVDKQWTLVGIVSWAAGINTCAMLGYPDVFSRVAYFHDWVVNKLASNQ